MVFLEEALMHGPSLILCSSCTLYRIFYVCILKSNKSLLIKEAMESMDNIRTVAALTKEQTIYKIFSERLWTPFKKNMKSKLWVCLVSGFTQGLTYWAFGACFFYGSRLLKKDDVGFSDIFR